MPMFAINGKLCQMPHKMQDHISVNFHAEPEWNMEHVEHVLIHMNKRMPIEYNGYVMHSLPDTLLNAI